jgi:hypothetical protein
MQQEARDCASDVADAIRDGLRQIGDISYAIMPRDVAHAVGDFKKALLSTIRGALDSEIEWINDRVAGGDKLREEWRERCRRAQTETAPQSGGV